jgi:hypothetical protein
MVSAELRVAALAREAAGEVLGDVLGGKEAVGRHEICVVSYIFDSKEILLAHRAFASISRKRSVAHAPEPTV